MALVSAKIFLNMTPASTSNKAKIDHGVVSTWSEDATYGVEESICKPYI